MAGELILRYWPVDGSFVMAQNTYIKFGVAARLQTPGPPYYEYDNQDPTLAQIDYQYNLDGNGTGPLIGGLRPLNMASVVSLEGVPEGQYSEAAVLLLDENGLTVPVSLADMPLTLYLIGMTGSPQRKENPSRWSDPGSTEAGAGYAGGAIEVGLYDDGVFVSLGSAWVDGSYFTPKVDGTSWDNPVLPSEANVRHDREASYVYFDLAPSGQISAFWDQRIGTVEDVEVSGGGSVQEPQIFSLTAAIGGSNTGYAQGEYGSMTPGKLLINRVEYLIRQLTISGGSLYLFVGSDYAGDAQFKITVNDWEVTVPNNGEAMVPLGGGFVAGQTYSVRIDVLT